MRKKKSYK